jgi:hypothetical protein
MVAKILCAEFKHSRVDDLQHSSRVYLQNNAKCHENIRQGFLSLNNYMSNSVGRQQIDQMFELNPKFNDQPDDQILQHFFVKLLNSFMVSVENNNVNKAINRLIVNAKIQCLAAIQQRPT